MTKSASVTANKTAMPLAIIGLGCLFPQAGSLNEYWTNIRRGVDTISDVPLTHWSPEDYFSEDPSTPDKTYGRKGGFLSPVQFNPMEFGILPNALEAIDSSQLLGLIATQQALNNAGYTVDREFDRTRISTLLGVTGATEMVIPLGARLGRPIWRQAMLDSGVPAQVADEAVERIAEGYVPWQENSFPGLLGNVVAGRIARHFDFGGTNCVVDAACGSSLSALHLAALELESGRSDMVVTGGVDTFNDIFMYTCFSKTPALSPEGNAKPFDANGDGTILGEGLGVLVLKRLEDATRDNDKIVAVIKGLGTSSDGKGEAIYAPNAKGQVEALRNAYRLAQVSPETVEMIEAHGTGTKVGDAVEVRALREVFGDATSPWCALGSVKSQIGHTKAAAGAAGIVKAALALHHKVLPPTIKVTEPLPAVVEGDTPFYINTEARPWLPKKAHPRRAGVSSFGFGGSNYHVVLEEYARDRSETVWDGEVQILAFSAESSTGVLQKVQALDTSVVWDELREQARETRESFSATDTCRLLWVTEPGSERLERQKNTIVQMLTAEEVPSCWEAPDGIYWSQCSGSPKTAILFPGQGAQYPGMLQDLANQFPEFLKAVSEAHLRLEKKADLAGTLFPPPSFDTTTKKAQVSNLTRTEMAQPALGAVSIGAYHLLKRFGVQGDLFSGHSYGELVALCAAGAYNPETLSRLSRLRGELMAGDGADLGTMLAVALPLEEIDAFLQQEDLDLVLANRNTPEQGVLSGTREAIVKAEEILKTKGARCTRLDVAAAFHSPLVEKAAEPLLKALQDGPFQSPAAPVFSNTLGEEYPADTYRSMEVLAGQLARPVQFVKQIEAMYKAGARVFIEVGPGSRLAGMAKRILGDRPHRLISLDGSSGRRSGVFELAKVLGLTASLGHPIRLQDWDPPTDTHPGGAKPGLTVEICGANYRSPFEPMPKAERQLVPPGQTPAAASDSVSPVTENLGSQPLQEALQATQVNLQALQQLQQQTAQLHQQFLANQEASSLTLQALLQQQTTLGLPGSPPVAPAPVQAPQPLVAPVSQAVVSQSFAPAAKGADLTSPPTADTGSTGRVAQVLMGIIAEKTGYPAKMLESSMALEADLGIDSIKRVEILSALQEQLPEAPAIGPDQLGTLQTLQQIIDYLAEGMPQEPKTPQSAPATSAPASASAQDREAAASALMTIISDKTGYPVEMLDPSMALEADLGIDSIKRVEILSALQEQLPEAPAIGPDQLGTLQTLQQIIDYLTAGLPAVTTAAMTSVSSRPAGQKVSEILLGIVADKTGYPVEMLDPSMALETDLGIDSIKRVEILSALQEQLPEAPTIGPDQLGTLQTLSQIIDYLSQGQAAITPSSSVQEAPVLSSSSTDRGISDILLGIVADKTGYPVEMLDPSMALETDLGIDSIKRVEILSALQEQLPEAPAIGPDQLGTLQTLQQIIDFLGIDHRATDQATLPSSETEPVETVDTTPEVGETALIRKLVSAVPFNGRHHRTAVAPSPETEVWVTSDGSPLAESLAMALQQKGQSVRLIDPYASQSLEWPASLRGLIVLSPAGGADAQWSWRGYQLIQAAAKALKAAGRKNDAFLLTVSRLDGAFGFHEESELEDVYSGGLAGLCKTAAFEWPDVRCKAIDLAPEMDNSEKAAEAIAEEAFIVGPGEVGLNSDQRIYLEVQDTIVPEKADPAPIQTGDLVVLTGGGRGVTAEVAVAMAERWQPTLLLLDRSPDPEPEPEWLSVLTDEGEIKKGLLKHLPEKPTPKELQEACHKVLNNRELQRNMDRMRDAGAQVVHRSTDVRDPEAVKKALDDAIREFGPVRGLAHGAGVLADRLIVDKTAEQFDRVYGTKVEGLRNALKGLDPRELRFLTLFSSSTARFGRKGQSDYAVANETLNKMAQSFVRRYPECRTLAVNWGPWDGGMVNDALKQLFAEEGIGVVGRQTGSRYLLDELSIAGPTEVVILGQLPEEAQSPETAENGSAFPVALQTSLEFDLDVDAYPFLESHVVGGKAVLPMAMIIEWMSHGALHANPGFTFLGFEDLRILSGVKLNATETIRLQVLTGEPEKTDDLFRIPVSLHSLEDGHRRRHSQAWIQLAFQRPERQPQSSPVELPPYQGSVYSGDRLFHGTDLHGIEEVTGCSTAGISARVKPAPRPVDWIRHPFRSSWLSDPLALDSSFQMMILWSLERRGAASLPNYAGSFRQYVDRFPESGVDISIRVIEDREHTARADIDFIDPANGKLVASLENYECTIDASLIQAFRSNQLVRQDNVKDQGIAG